MIRRRFLQLGLVLLGLGLGARTSFAGESWSSTCPSGAIQAAFSLHSTLELRSALLPPQGEREKFFREAALQQVLYYRKAYEERWGQHKAQVIHATEDPRIEIRSKAEAKSQYTYEVDTVKHPDVKLELPYLLHALEKAHLAQGEPTLRLEYEAKWAGMICSSGSGPDKSTAVIAPLDPYLAHWIAAPSERRMIKWRDSRFAIAPIFDEEYADIPHPFYGWYFWRPEAEGKDENGKPYAARDVLKLGKNAIEANVLLEPGEKVPPLAFRKPTGGRLNVTAFFGIVDAKAVLWKPSETFAKRKGGTADWPRLQAELKGIYPVAGIDRGSQNATDFLVNLPYFLDMRTFRYSYDPASLMLTVHGLLRKSKAALRLQVFFGPTDVLSGDPPRHWKSAKEAIEKDDIVIYVGHSGLGENFKLANFEANAGKLHAKTDQLLAVLSCYSYSYYNGVAASRELLLTGSEYGSARAPVGILIWYDMAAKDPKAELPYVLPGDFLVLRTLQP